jgi:hypothetical protein
MKNGRIMNDFNTLVYLSAYLPMNNPRGNPIINDRRALSIPWVNEFMNACRESIARVPVPENDEISLREKKFITT